MRLPDFLIIGAMKAGTTSIHNYLGMHPDIYTTNQKEIHFFDDNNYRKSIEDYRKNFDVKERAVGTSPQSYTKQHIEIYRKVPERLFYHIPNVKLIYIVRDPIQRIYSHYREQQAGGYASKQSLNKQLKNFKKNHFVNTSRYYFQISKFLNYFPYEQIKIVTLESIHEQKMDTLNEIFDFLNVKKLTNTTSFDFVSNRSSAKKQKHHLKTWIPARVKNYYRNTLGNKQREFLNNKFFNYLYFENRLKAETIDAELMNAIKSYLKEDVNQLRDLTGDRYDSWSV